MTPLSLERPCLVGVVHLGALPGAPGFAGDLDRVVERAVTDAVVYRDSGFTGIVIENLGDLPFYAETVAAETVAAMARVGTEVRQAVGAEFPLGFNVLRNDAASALGLCAACDGAFLRVNVHTGAMVTDQGVWVCPILVNRPAGRMGARLADSLEAYPLRHQACWTCHVEGATCRT